jgi:hypothetical protein
MAKNIILVKDGREQAVIKYRPNPRDKSDVIPESFGCPDCGEPLEYFVVRGIPAFLYCADCNDVAYDPNTGTKIGGLG